MLQENVCLLTPWDCKEQQPDRQIPCTRLAKDMDMNLFSDLEAQTDNMQFAERSFYSFEPSFATDMVKFTMSLE